jgi:putative MATE family efflux protein
MERFKKFVANKVFYKHVLTLAVPLMVQQLVTSSLNLVDNLMIGQLGDAALGGVAASNRFFIIGLFSVMGVLSAAAVFIAQYYGAKDEDNMREAFRFSIVSALGISVLFFAIATFFPSVVIRFFTNDPSIIDAGIKYMTIVGIAVIPQALSGAMASAMRSVGETKIPLYIGIFAVLTNAILNYGLIFGHFGLPELGIQGAAIATVIARLVELSLLLVVMKNRVFHFTTRFADLLIVSKRNMKKISLKALPLMTNELFWSFGMATLFKFYATRGKEVISGISIAGTTADLFFVLFGGMAVATTIVISQPLGANDLNTARKNGYYMLGFSTSLAVLFGIAMFATSYVVPQFYNVSVESQNIASTILRIQSVMFWIYMSTAQSYFILRAGGDMKSTLMMDAGFMWFINIPIVGLVTYLTGVNIFWLFIIGQSTDFIKLTLAYGLIKKERWLNNLTLDEFEQITETT